MNLEEIKTIARKRKTEKEIGVKGGGEDLETVQGLLVVEDVGDHDQGHETAVAGQDQGTEEDLGPGIEENHVEKEKVLVKKREKEERRAYQ